MDRSSRDSEERRCSGRTSSSTAGWWLATAFRLGITY
jgi:hypothetical protein